VREYASFLEWLKEKFEYGYIRNRGDGVCEYTIVGIEPVFKILSLLKPYLRLKKLQAELAILVLSKMPGTGRKMEPKTLLNLSYEVDKFSDLNYSKRRTNTSIKVKEFLKSHNLLNPVETES